MAPSKDFFVKLFSDNLISSGYSYLKSHFLFKKKIDNGIENIISFNSWNSFTRIESSYEIIIPEIERVKKKAWGTLYHKFVTVGHKKEVILKYFFNDKTDVNITVYSENDIKKYIKNEVDFLNTRGGVFFNYFSNIEDVYKYISGAVYSEWIVYNKIEYCYLAIIVTYLINPSSLQEMINLLSPIILRYKASETQQEKFDLLIKYFGIIQN